MIQYRKILELHFKKVSQRTIRTSVGSSRNTVSEVIKCAEGLGLESLIDTMNNHRLEEFLFPEKQVIEKGYFPPDWEKIHKELQKMISAAGKSFLAQAFGVSACRQHHIVKYVRLP